jgi:hypothetical protein
MNDSRWLDGRGRSLRGCSAEGVLSWRLASLSFPKLAERFGDAGVAWKLCFRTRVDLRGGWAFAGAGTGRVGKRSFGAAGGFPKRFANFGNQEINTWNQESNFRNQESSFWNRESSFGDREGSFRNEEGRFAKQSDAEGDSQGETSHCGSLGGYFRGRGGHFGDQSSSDCRHVRLECRQIGSDRHHMNSECHYMNLGSRYIGSGCGHIESGRKKIGRCS